MIPSPGRKDTPPLQSRSGQVSMPCDNSTGTCRSPKLKLPGADEVWQGVVSDHVYGLGIRGGVAEGLHHQVGRKAQTGQVLQLVSVGTTNQPTNQACDHYLRFVQHQVGNPDLVIGPVVSCEPTVVMAGSQYWPGRTP